MPTAYFFASAPANDRLDLHCLQPAEASTPAGRAGPLALLITAAWFVALRRRRYISRIFDENACLLSALDSSDRINVPLRMIFGFDKESFCSTTGAAMADGTAAAKAISETMGSFMSMEVQGGRGKEVEG